MSETSLYYTLSTVSQTLAGALGMLAAFLALRVSALDTAIRGDLTELEQRGGGPNVEVRPRNGSMSEALASWRTRFNARELESGTSYGVILLRRAEEMHGSKDYLLQEAQKAFIVSTLVMAVCFVGLASAQWLSRLAALAALAAGVVILGAVACLVWYARIVGAALK